MKYRYENCVVDRIVDGDTIIVTIDLGFHLKTQQSFRLNRINAPEVRTKDLEEKRKGLEAKKALEDMLDGANIILETHKAGKYGRWLAEVYYDGVNVNDWLVGVGLAQYKDY